MTKPYSNNEFLYVEHSFSGFGFLFSKPRVEFPLPLSEHLQGTKWERQVRLPLPTN